MKKILVLLAGVFLSSQLFAQEDYSDVKSSKSEFKVNSVFNHKPGKPHLQLGYFFELNGGYTQFGSKNVFLPGLSMGMILNHNWSVGLTGSAIGNPGNLYYNDIYSPDGYSAMYGANLVGGYGGGLIEYTAFPGSMVHFSVPVMIGAGYFSYIDDYYYGNDFMYDHHNWNYSTIDWNVCFVVEPGVKLEFNIIKMLRLGLGVSYRYSPNFELVNTPADLLNQFTGRLSLRFGKF
jgi:hypothetical protein